MQIIKLVTITRDTSKYIDRQHRFLQFNNHSVAFGPKKLNAKKITQKMMKKGKLGKERQKSEREGEGKRRKRI